MVWKIRPQKWVPRTCLLETGFGCMGGFCSCCSGDVKRDNSAHNASKPPRSGMALMELAEGVGFEPTVACATTDFESVTFDLSDTPPECQICLSAFFVARNLWKKTLN